MSRPDYYFLGKDSATGGDANFVFSGIGVDEIEGLTERFTLFHLMEKGRSGFEPIAAFFQYFEEQFYQSSLLDWDVSEVVALKRLVEPDFALVLLVQCDHPGGYRKGSKLIKEPLESYQ